MRDACLLVPPPLPERGESPSDEDITLRLLHQYAPVLVHFPEGKADDEPPFPNGRSDYFPRGVALLLDTVANKHTRYAQHSMMLRFAVALVVLVLVGASVVAYLLVVRPEFGEIPGHLFFAAVVAWIPGAVLFGILQEIGKQLAKTESRETYGELIFSRSQVDKGPVSSDSFVPRDGWLTARDGQAAWAAYTGPGRPAAEITVYGRATFDGTYAVLQYWLFWPYNDWANTHVADWEVAMVFLPMTMTGGVQQNPEFMAASCHHNCHRRPWAAVPRITTATGSHPAVYVARGSHALYFERETDGTPVRGSYDTLPVVGLRVRKIPLIGRSLRRVAGETTQRDIAARLRLKDGTPEDGCQTEHPYRLDVLPRDWSEIDPADEDGWARWWWLRYRGQWGNGVYGPAVQAEKWDTPVRWAKERAL